MYLEEKGLDQLIRMMIVGGGLKEVMKQGAGAPTSARHIASILTTYPLAGKPLDSNLIHESEV